MQKNKIIPKKSLGQNFLRNNEILDEIIKVAKLSDKDNVLEIGPGEGILTKRLIKQVGKVIAIEKDKNLAVLMDSRLCKNGKVEVIEGDILKINLPKLIEENDFFSYKIVANIPYYITGKLFRIIFENKYRPKLMVLMVQKEVADRICAKTGKMNKLAILVKYFGNAKIVCEVGKENFFPVPKVDSAVIKIEIKNQDFDLEEYKKLFRVIRIGFSNPRKTLMNNLKVGLKIEKEKIEEIFKNENLNINIRAQNLNLRDWKDISENFY